MRALEWFTRHPASVGETYSQHLLAAWKFSARLLLACVASFVHGVLPRFCERTASRSISQLHQRMKFRRSVPSRGSRVRPPSPL
jgi:hypothetical protein